MANVTDGEKQSTTQELFCETGFEARQKMLILISLWLSLHFWGML